jgi:hypothetical protein
MVTTAVVMPVEANRNWAKAVLKATNSPVLMLPPI